MGDRAVILLQRGAAWDKQIAACLEWIEQQRIPWQSVIPHGAPNEAVRLVRSGDVDTVVMAYDSRVAFAVAADIQGHGRVVVVRPEPHEIPGPDPAPEPKKGLPSLVDLILRWTGKGRTVEEIAADIDGDTTDVRAILRRAGKQPPRSD